MPRLLLSGAARFGLASHACRYLAIIKDREGVTPKELSEFLRVRSPTTLAALRTLEDKRLITRTREEGDGRKSLYRLTAKGEEVEKQVRQSPIEVEKRAISDLTGTEIETLGAMVGRIRNALEADADEDD